ncbi:MAG: 4Fe-4S dicluster domain-containing protein [Chrysiogenales bacterium]
MQIQAPPLLDRWLQKIKYALLILIILWPLIYRQKLFLKLDPFKALFNLEGSTFLLLFGGLVLISSLFFYRPFCRYVCPFGAAAGIINRLGFFHLKMKIDQTCSGCNSCLSRCPATAIRPQRGQGAMIDAANCIACGECGAACKKMT